MSLSEILMSLQESGRSMLYDSQKQLKQEVWIMFGDAVERKRSASSVPVISEFMTLQGPSHTTEKTVRTLRFFKLV